MKVIDLLNKIANGEEVSKYIKYENDIYEFDTMMGDYYSYKIKKWFSEEYCDGRSLRGCLNDEVEIIEEEHKIPEKLNTWYGIEPVNLDSPTTFKDNSKYIDFNTEMFFDKINEIIDYLENTK